jgi:DNA (cytosine-5)-methyltransferase 1
MLRVGTLFSGIGAFEQALKQLGIPHIIEFACDNGELELIPLQKIQDRWEYKRLDRHAKGLDEAQMVRYLELKAKVSEEIERIREEALRIEDKRQLHDYIADIYRKYGVKKENKMRKAYLANYTIDEDNFYTDVRFMNGTIYTNQIDIMVGGSPCQSFSTYGKKRGLEDTRGTLFYDYARIIQEVQPKIFIYENVPGLLTHDGGKTWQIMKEVWSSLGYIIDNSIDVLNAADYNHPQNRKRLFLIGFKKDIYTQPYVFPPKQKLTF